MMVVKDDPKENSPRRISFFYIVLVVTIGSLVLVLSPRSLGIGGKTRRRLSEEGAQDEFNRRPSAADESTPPLHNLTHVGEKPTELRKRSSVPSDPWLQQPQSKKQKRGRKGGGNLPPNELEVDQLSTHVEKNSTQASSRGRETHFLQKKFLRSLKLDEVSDDFEGFDVDEEILLLRTNSQSEQQQQKKKKKTLEFLKKVPPILDWRRKQQRRKGSSTLLSSPSSERTERNQRRKVNAACLYSGFLRNYDYMFKSCPLEWRMKDGSCINAKKSNVFGDQYERILGPGALNCDIFISTWNIRGSGGYKVREYDLKDQPKQLSENYIKNLYGDRLAGLHIQNYSAYQPLWFHMRASFRMMQQLKVTKWSSDAWSRLRMTGVPQQLPFYKVNDYSQAYKWWCVTMMANRFASYDLYFRLRLDARALQYITDLRFLSPEELPQPTGAGGADADDESITQLSSKINISLPAATWDWEALSPETTDPKFKESEFVMGKTNEMLNEIHREEKAPKSSSEEEEMKGEDVITFNLRQDIPGVPSRPFDTTHFVSKGRLFSNDFTFADLGFMGTPKMITELAKVWWMCLAPSNKRAENIEEIELSSSMPISEYNRNLWYIVFSKGWIVDSGNRTLRLSRVFARSGTKRGHF